MSRAAWAENQPDKGPTIYLQQRYVVHCTCGWTSYPYLDEGTAVIDWRDHQRSDHSDGSESEA